MTDHGGMALDDYLIDKLQSGRKFKSANTSWDGSETVTTRVEDEHGDMWKLEIRRDDGP